MLPTLHTARLTLRPFTLADSDAVERLAGHEAVARTAANIPHPYPEGAAKTWIATHQPGFERGKLIAFAVESRSTGELMGCVSMGLHLPDLRGELGYWMGFDFWNQGYTTEATRECMRFAFKHFHLAKIGGGFYSTNPSSGRVMEKLGMRREGYRRRHMMKNGVLMDLVEYGILREEFFAAAPIPGAVHP